MSDVLQASDLIKKVVPRDHRSVGEWVRDTYHVLRTFNGNWSYGRTESIWYEVARRIDAWEMDTIRRAIEANECERRDAAQQLEEARADYRELRARYLRQKHAMGNTDADFFGPQLDALALKVARFLAPEIEGSEDD